MNIQVVLGAVTPPDASAPLWRDTRIVPVYVAGVSAAVLVLSIAFSAVRAAPSDVHNEAPSAKSTRAHVVTHGGWSILAFKLTRAMCVFALLGLFAYGLARGVREAVEFAVFLTYLYASGLALLNVAASAPVARRVAPHLILLLLASCAVYGYRDIWPLMTYTLHSADCDEGFLLWIKIALLAVSGIVVPLVIPRQYVPADLENPSEHPSPEQTCSILSLLTYSFLDKHIHAAYTAPKFGLDTLPEIADYDRAEHNISKGFRHLDVFSGARKQHLFIALVKTFGREYAMLAVLMVLLACAELVSPIGINRLLNYLETGGKDAVVRPWVWCLLIFIGPLTYTVTIQFYGFSMSGMLVRAEGILTQLIFEHALRLRVTSEEASQASQAEEAGAATAGSSSAASKPSEDNGKQARNLVGLMNSLVTTDLQAVVNGRNFLFMAVYPPITIAFSIYFLFLVLGWSAFVGLAVMIVCLPFPGYLAKRMQSAEQSLAKRTDARVQTVSETMNILRMIKMFGFEGKVLERVGEKRDEELRWLKRSELTGHVADVITHVLPVLQIVATYATYTIMGGRLTSAIVFSSMAVFTLLRNQIGMLVFFAPFLIRAKVSLDRISDFLRDTELLDRYAAAGDGQSHSSDTSASVISPSHSSVIGIRNASFTWSAAVVDSTAAPSRRTFTLRVNDELTFKRGVVNLIVGPTGSGKTSLLMALLGEMHYVPLAPDAWVSLPRAGGVAYAAQESWVQNETIRDNILFGAPYDETRYNKVIYQCGLERDLSLFEAGDSTEVGEKGLTLSGGQKARVTLARAIYSQADIILLDDVLAALDVHTAKWVVQKCLKGDLVRGRTVILVTHNVALTADIAGFVVSIGGGTITARGSYGDVFSEDKMVAQEVAQEQEVLLKAEEEVAEKQNVGESEERNSGKLIVEEDVAEGRVSRRSLNLFWLPLGGDHPMLFWIVFLSGMFLHHVFQSAQLFFLGQWADAYSEPRPVDVTYYLTGFVALAFGTFLMLLVAVATYVFGVIRAVKKIHGLLMNSILGTTFRWMDTTPTSRVITRFTKDMKAVDSGFSTQFQWFTRYTTQVITQLVAIALVTPAVILPGVVVFLIGAWFANIYMKAQLPVKREMSNRRAPVLAHFGAAMAGLTSIRAYGAEEAFRQESYRRIESYIRSGRMFYNLNLWIASRSDFFAAAFSAGLGVYLVYGPSAATIGASNVGFSLSMAAAFSSMILWVFRVGNNLEVEANSLERIQAYLEIEQESKPTKEGLPPAAWPASGSLRVDGLSARYSPGGPKVLHDLSFTVNSGERVGIVGRTGSGKSSLTLSLLRCIYTEGGVYYDGVDTANLNLDVLRKNMTIIPQVPELLSGTLRENLNPFGEHDDAALNSALRASGLFSLQADTDDGRITLDSQIASGGGNLSVGQRQILALARALVRGSKLLILDEATSSIDYKTDSIIQSSLRNGLGGDVTLLTVAHRLQTIMDADKIMVLDAGRIVEYDSPKTLLQKDGGFLKSLVDESGDKDALYAMAGV